MGKFACVGSYGCHLPCSSACLAPLSFHEKKVDEINGMHGLLVVEELGFIFFMYCSVG